MGAEREHSVPVGRQTFLRGMAGAALLAGTGNLARLWRPVGELRSIGVWRAADEDELHEKVLGTLPLRPWMTLTVTALGSHPNDPGRTDATP